jgi:CRISPR type III-A-associated protein Csm2
MAEEREVGTVKRYDSDKGFGFIGRRTGEDVFVHRTDVERAGLPELNAGDRVSFVVRRSQRGFQATSLALDTSSAPATAPRTPTPSVPGNQRPSTATNFRFGSDYLADGYFEERDHERYLRPETLDSTAMDVAKVLVNRDMKPSQLRRFFNKARGIEAKLDRERNFEAIKADIYGFKRDVAYQVGRGIVPEEFQQFINRNVELAVKDELSFRKGFLQHFESVLAYFVYFFRDR